MVSNLNHSTYQTRSYSNHTHQKILDLGLVFPFLVCDLSRIYFEVCDLIATLPGPFVEDGLVEVNTLGSRVVFISVEGFVNTCLGCVVELDMTTPPTPKMRTHNNIPKQGYKLQQVFK